MVSACLAEPLSETISLGGLVSWGPQLLLPLPIPPFTRFFPGSGCMLWVLVFGELLMLYKATP